MFLGCVTGRRVGEQHGSAVQPRVLPDAENHTEITGLQARAGILAWSERVHGARPPWLFHWGHPRFDVLSALQNGQRDGRGRNGVFAGMGP